MYKFKSSQIKTKGICLFLNGIPGLMKERQIFDDLINLGMDIYTFYYPGTYNEKGLFNIENCLSLLKDNLIEINKKNLPITIIAYSFSSYLVQLIDWSAYNNVKGISLFSPITGLNNPIHINSNFIESLVEIENRLLGQFNIDYESIKNHIDDDRTEPIERIQKLLVLQIPISTFYSLNDSVINVGCLSNSLNQIKLDLSFNAVYNYESPDGNHLLDSYYCPKIRSYLEAQIIAEDIRSITGNSTGIYYWGSGNTSSVLNEQSDIDLLVFTEQNHLDYESELRSYQNDYHKIGYSHFDLSINDIRDLYKLKPFRFNRGATILHELVYHYYPFYKLDHLPEVSWDNVLIDAFNATLINLNEAKKIFMKTPLDNKRIHKIPKFFYYSLIYLLYFKGLKTFDWNCLDSYFDNSDPLKDILLEVITIRKNNYTGITIKSLRRQIDAMIEIHQLQENNLKAKGLI